MDTYIAYFDETGDDGANTASSNQFVLTSLYMSTDSWQNNFDKVRECRKWLKEQFGFHMSEEFHTRHLVRGKGFYREHGWTNEQRQDILIAFTKCIASLDAKIINVVIDKTKITANDYKVLENALTYNIQRIENDSNGKWKYLIISDNGRGAPMRKTARAIRSYNPVQSRFGGYQNQPIQGLIEDIMEKDSRESYFIQICDFVSYFADLYYRTAEKNETLPNRVGRVVDNRFVKRLMVTLKKGEVLNLKASSQHPYGFVIYPK